VSARRIVVATLCAGLLCAACTETGGPEPGRTAPAPVVTAPAAAHLGRPAVLTRHLAVPWAIAFLPDGDALITERDSARLLRVTWPAGVTVAGTVPGVAPYGEGGLLGVAVSPAFGQDHLVYLYLSTGTDNRIVRFRYSAGHIGRLHTVLTGIPRAAIHNGGRLAFGPDGMLWASTGEHGQPMLAQNTESLAGKILRMTPDGRPAPGNPFGTLVWSYGHRNVEGLAWDGAGRLYATEFGQDHLDEINRIEKGHNYAWPPDQASPAPSMTGQA
jgi:glucose/arabinose dehydrogenase